MSPTGWGRRLAKVLLHPLDAEERGEILADLEELRQHRRQAGRRALGFLWYWWDLGRLAWTLRAQRAVATESLRRPVRFVSSGLLDSVVQDLRYAVRGLVRMPGVTLVALPTLALGIGATTALFSFADALMLRPLPVQEPDRLLALYHVSTKDATYFSSFSYPDYLELRSTDGGLADVAAYSDLEVHLGDGADAGTVAGEIVSANYFSVLGVEPVLGRAFTPDEDQTPGAAPVVILSETLWVGTFGADPSVLGKEVTINGHPFTVVGVVPRSTPSADFHAEPRLWVPLMMHDVVLPSFRAGGMELFYNRGTHWLGLLGRLDRTATPKGVDVALKTVARRQAAENPETNGAWTIIAMPMGSVRAGPPGTSLLARLTALLAAVVVMVLLIACANVANLLLARATVRRQEMAVRVAIGAGRARLIRQMLSESLLMALAGGLGGVLLAMWAVRALPSLGVTSGLPGLDVRLDPRVLTFALTTTLVCGLVAGLAPALRASTAEMARVGRSPAAYGGGGRARLPLQKLLVSVQVALSLILLVGAGLTLRTVRNLYAIPLGFDADDVRIAQVDFPDETSAAPTVVDSYADLLARVRSVPGVRSASLARIGPFSTRRMANDVFWENDDGTRNRTNVDMNVVGVDYFATMGIPLVTGRNFTGGDMEGSPDVAVVNEALAARFWPGQNPEGKQIWSWEPDGPGHRIVVVGVVANGRYYRAWRTAERPFVFLALGQHAAGDVYLHVRGAGPATPSVGALRRSVLATVPAPEMSDVETVRAARAESVSVERTSAKLLGLFGLLAGTIAVMGIYGVVSFTVSRRTREMGLRMALGARAGDVRRNVVAGSAGPILVGAAVGWLAALYLSRFVAGFLYEIGPRNPLTFGAVGAGLVAAGLLASVVPARRATRVDPLVALRNE